MKMNYLFLKKKNNKLSKLCMRNFEILFFDCPFIKFYAIYVTFDG